MSSSSVVVGGGVAHSSSAIVAHAMKGSHVLKIEGYSRTKALGNDKFIKSTTFDIGGYHWCVKYYPDGNTTENAGWISLFLNLIENNATGVEARINLALLDDVGEPVSSYSSSGDGVVCTFKSGHSSWGYPKFIESKSLEDSKYLKDDCFRVRFDVTVFKEIRSEDTPQFVRVPPSDIMQHMGRLLSSGVAADVTLQVGDETFAAHRLVLGARSSVFMAELFGPMKEKGTSHIVIDDMEPRVFRALLHFIYTDELPDNVFEQGDTYGMSQHLLVAADRYGLERLKLICEDKLFYCINTSIVTTTLVLAEQHSCKGLKEACFRFLKSPGNLKAIMDDADGFQHLTNSCPTLLNELLANVAP